jgi:hypothetical protein
MLVTFILSLGLAWAQGDDHWEDPVEAIYGNWQFHRYIHNGVQNPIPNPQLVLQYEFLLDGTNRLFWIRKNETGFCERKARFEYDGQFIDQEVTWVNPENARECRQDVDMQLGNINRARLERKEEFLHLHVPFSGDEFIYVFRRIR